MHLYTTSAESRQLATLTVASAPLLHNLTSSLSSPTGYARAVIAMRSLRNTSMQEWSTNTWI